MSTVKSMCDSVAWLDGGRLIGVRAGPARIEARLGAAADVMTVTVDP